MDLVVARVKAPTIPPYFWTDEDGDWYYCEAHINEATMKEKARAFEKECGFLDDETREKIEEMTLRSHVWVLWDPNDDEAPGRDVPKGTPGAVPVTTLG